MNNKQLQNATEEMTSWLSHPAELGKPPAKIECAKEIDYKGLHYYIFKYKKTALGKWLLGICGGYEGDELQNCGHTFSEMEEYSEKTAEQKAIELIEQVMNMWKEQAERAEAEKEHPGSFVNFVLLDDVVFEKETILKALKEDWQIEDSDDENDVEDDDDSNDSDNDEELEERDDTIILFYGGGIATISLMPGPIPEEEAVYCAESNFLWKDAVETVKRHKAHILVSFTGKETPVKEAGEIMVKLVVSACKQRGVLGIYANETVYKPEYYLDCAEMLKEGEFPLYNLVWFGLYRGKEGFCAYTQGMRSLGYDEMEIVDSKQQPSDILDMLFGAAAYVVDSDVILNDGETIGFSAEQKLPITKSRGAAVEGDSLKIGF